MQILFIIPKLISDSEIFSATFLYYTLHWDIDATIIRANFSRSFSLLSKNLFIIGKIPCKASLADWDLFSINTSKYILQPVLIAIVQ